ncbi:MAG: methylamine utilization protein [Ideonella sp.]
MNAAACVGAALIAWLSVVSASAAVLEVTLTGSDDKPLADAVIAVYVKGTKPTAAAGITAEIAQRSRQFAPQLTVVQTGTGVLFPNFDTVRHHVYSFSPIQRFEIKLYAGVPNAPLIFDKPGVATLGCNIHDRMLAFVAVVDTPFFARSNAAGKAQIDLPAGKHRLMAWHPSMTETGVWVEQSVTVDASGGRSALKLPVTAMP